MTLIIFPCMNLDLEGLHDFDHFSLHVRFRMLISEFLFHLVVMMLLVVWKVPSEMSLRELIVHPCRNMWMFVFRACHVRTCDMLCE